jgi:phosphate starvation-inducible PhoH-like protein
MNQTKEISLPWEHVIQQVELFGINDEYIKFIEESFHVSVVFRDDMLKIQGQTADAENAAEVMKALLHLLKKGQTLEKHTVEYISNLVKQGQLPGTSYNDIVCYTVRGKQIRSKTIGQTKYVQAIAQNDIVFGIGPAYGD